MQFDQILSGSFHIVFMHEYIWIRKLRRFEWNISNTNTFPHFFFLMTRLFVNKESATT